MLSEDDAQFVIDRLMGIVRNPKATFRAITSASRVLLAYRRVNLDAIRTAAACDSIGIQEQLDALEERLEHSRD